MCRVAARLTRDGGGDVMTRKTPDDLRICLPTTTNAPGLRFHANRHENPDIDRSLVPLDPFVLCRSFVRNRTVNASSASPRHRRRPVRVHAHREGSTSVHSPRREPPPTTGNLNCSNILALRIESDAVSMPEAWFHVSAPSLAAIDLHASGEHPEPVSRVPSRCLSANSRGFTTSRWVSQIQ
jgi:hypothetical protein